MSDPNEAREAALKAYYLGHDPHPDERRVTASFRAGYDAGRASRDADVEKLELQERNAGKLAVAHFERALTAEARVEQLGRELAQANDRLTEHKQRNASLNAAWQTATKRAEKLERELDAARLLVQAMEDDRERISAELATEKTAISQDLKALYAELETTKTRWLAAEEADTNKHHEVARLNGELWKARAALKDAQMGLATEREQHAAAKGVIERVRVEMARTEPKPKESGGAEPRVATGQVHTGRRSPADSGDGDAEGCWHSPTPRSEPAVVHTHPNSSKGGRGKGGQMFTDELMPCNCDETYAIRLDNKSVCRKCGAVWA